MKEKIVYNKYTLIITALFLLTLIASNISGGKIISLYVWGKEIDFSAALLFFPLTYSFSDILTEAYGGRTARFVVYLVLIFNLLFIFMVFLTVEILPSPIWHGQKAYSATLMLSSRIFIASVCGFLSSELMNIGVMVKLKELLRSRFMPLRFVSSTFIGVVVGSCVFYIAAFGGVYRVGIIIEMALVELVMKVAYDACMLPVSCRVAKYLKAKGV